MDDLRAVYLTRGLGRVKVASQRAHAPSNSLKAGIDDEARNNARVMHELLFRVAVAL